MTRRPIAVEIDDDEDAAWLRGQQLPDGVEAVELDEVEFYGRTYDRAPGSLLYVPTTADPTERAIARHLAKAEPEPAPIGVDLFSGAGGFSLGMHQAGIDVVAAVEWDVFAAMTYTYNLGADNCVMHFASDKDRERWELHKKKQAQRDAKNGITREHVPGHQKSSGIRGGCRAFFLGDISSVTGRAIMDAAHVDHVNVVFGGPPCQGLSTANAKACIGDPRNAMLWEYLRIVVETDPDYFIIENVPPILTVAKGALFNALCARANEAGYNVVANVLNAADYGVPQTRRRAIIVGSRDNMPAYRYPMPSTWAYGRPIDDEGWEFPYDASGDTRGRRKAVYDAESRTWNVEASDDQPPTVDDHGEPDLFSEVGK